MTERARHRGSWAGDRLVITGEREMFTNDEDGEYDYEDVTDAVLRERVWEVYEADFGGEWEEARRLPVQDGYQFWYWTDNNDGVGREGRVISERPPSPFW